ncbi:MAG: hypothetical protein ACRCYO_16900 [Bacteroidia bacterium]
MNYFSKQNFHFNTQPVKPSAGELYAARQENSREDGRERCEVAFENELTGLYRQAHFHCNLVFVVSFLCYFLWTSKESKEKNFHFSTPTVSPPQANQA